MPAEAAPGQESGDPPRKSWFRRLSRIAVLAAVLLVGVLVARSVIADGMPDLSSEEGWIRFVQSMFRSGRDLRDRSQNLVAQVKQEMGGVETWLKDRKVELPSTDDLLKKADDLLASARDKVDTAMTAPEASPLAPPPVPDPGKKPVQVAMVDPKPTPPPVTAPVPTTPPTTPAPTPAPVQPPPLTTPRPEPPPLTAPKPTPTPVTGPVGTPTPTPAPVTTPKPTQPPPPPVTTPKPEPPVVTVPVTVLPTTPGPRPDPEPEPAAPPPPPPPPANPQFAEAQAVFQEGLAHYRKTRHGAPDMQQELRESARLFRKAQGLLEDASRREPKNGKIESLQVEVNRFLYDSLKRQTL